VNMVASLESICYSELGFSDARRVW
jgi:hypothetical protein